MKKGFLMLILGVLIFYGIGFSISVNAIPTGIIEPIEDFGGGGGTTNSSLSNIEIGEDYQLLFESAQLIPISNSSYMEVSGDIYSTDSSHDFDTFYFKINEGDYVKLSLEEILTTPGVFIEFYRDYDVDAHYPFVNSDVNELIGKYRDDSMFTSGELSDGILLGPGKYYILVSTVDYSVYHNTFMSYRFSIEANNISFDESYSFSQLYNMGIHGAIWKSLYDSDITYLYEDIREDLDYYPTNYSNDDEFGSWYLTEYLDLPANQLLTGSVDYLYSRIYFFDLDFVNYIISMLYSLVQDLDDVSSTFGSLSNIVSITFDSINMVLRIVGKSTIYTMVLSEIINCSLLYLEHTETEERIDEFKEKYSSYFNVNIAEMFTIFINSTDNSCDILEDIGDVLYGSSRTFTEGSEYIYMDFMATKRLGDLIYNERIETEYRLKMVNIAGSEKPFIGNQDEDDQIFSSGYESLYFENCLSKTEGLMTLIGEYQAGTGRFVEKESNYLINDNYKYVFDPYYNTEYHYSYKEYEYYDKLTFKIYKKGLIWDTYVDIKSFFIDESPSQTMDANLFSYYFYYVDDTFSATKYIGTGWYDSINGSTSYIYMKNRDSVSNGSYYVKIISLSKDYSTRYIKTTISGWYNTTKYSFSFDDYYYQYYKSYIYWTDYFGERHYTNKRYVRDFYVGYTLN
ncbi:MAG: hypothetical protein PHF05_06510 [Candidatus Izemoplasmatales bacterium]|nr:hypothetical protein [Candidatus Izemoplasmatales bacterium]